MGDLCKALYETRMHLFFIPHSIGNNDKYVSICYALVLHLKLSEKPLAKLPVVIGPDFTCDNSLINEIK